MKSALLSLMILAGSSTGAVAFWNPFSHPAPEVTAVYDPVACTGIAKILFTISNPTDEPLASYEYRIEVFKPQFSRRITEITGRTDYIVPAGSSRQSCLDVDFLARGTLFSMQYPSTSSFDSLMKYGTDGTNYEGREYLSDAIFRVEVTDYSYGLPY